MDFRQGRSAPCEARYFNSQAKRLLMANRS